MNRSPLTPLICESKDGRTFTIREATLADAANLIEYARAYFNEGDVYTPISPGEFNLTVEQEEGFVRSRQKDNAILLVAYAGDAMIGCLDIDGPANARTRHVGTLGVSVARSWRGQGVGGALMQAAIAWARAHPFMQRLQLEVFAPNPAFRLYQRLGFEEEGRRRRAYIFHGQPHDAVVMSMLFEKNE